MREQAHLGFGHLPGTLSDGSPATAATWIRTHLVTCPNPICGIETPLVRSWWLETRRGSEAYVVPTVVAEPTHPSRLRVRFELRHDPAGPAIEGTMRDSGAVACVACGAGIGANEIEAAAIGGRVTRALVAVVVEDRRRRVHLEPTAEHEAAARAAQPVDVVDQGLGSRPGIGWMPYHPEGVSEALVPRQRAAPETVDDPVAGLRDRVGGGAGVLRAVALSGRGDRLAAREFVGCGLPEVLARVREWILEDIFVTTDDDLSGSEGADDR